MKVDIYIAEESKQPNTDERWVGYIIEAEGGKGELMNEKSMAATSYRAMIMIIVQILDHFKRPAEITMHLDSGWVVGNLIRTKQPDGSCKSVLERWQENGWRRINKNEEVKNKDDWQRLYNKLRVFEQSGGTFEYVRLEKEDRHRARILRRIECAKQSS